MLSVVMRSYVLLSVAMESSYTKCCYFVKAECSVFYCYTECRCAERRYAEVCLTRVSVKLSVLFFIVILRLVLSVIILGVVILSVIILGVVMLSVIMLGVVMLSVVRANVVALLSLVILPTSPSSS
jgi:hypothetical protein